MVGLRGGVGLTSLCLCSNMGKISHETAVAIAMTCVGSCVGYSPMLTKP